MKEENKDEEAGCCSGNRGHSGSLRSLKISKVKCLKSLLPVRAFHSLKKLKIEGDMQMENMSQVGKEVLCSCSSSLRSLKLYKLPKLKNLSGGGLELLTALESLKLIGLFQLSFAEEGEEEADMPWKCLCQSLRSLKLWHLPAVVYLPKGMQHLTSLRSLDIPCLSLEALPEWIGCLSSVQSLCIIYCKSIESLPKSMQQLNSLTCLRIHLCSERLHRRCQSLNGQDWPKIQHIPDIDIKMD